MSVQHQLAIKSKNQSDLLDYRVLAHSQGPLSSEDFETLYNNLSVGNMPIKSRYEGESPPWLTFGPFHYGNKLYVGAVKQEWTSRQDGHGGRPVAAMCCLCLPYEELLAHHPSYENIYKQIPSQEFFLNTSDQSLSQADILFTSLEDQWQNIVACIDRIGFEFCASVAAFLLHSPVALLQGHDLNIHDRLAYLDAIVSLLPYGCRAALSVSTWMSSASSDCMRIGFTDQARPTQKRVVWGELPTAKEINMPEKAKGYYDLLLRIHKRHGTEKIIRAFAAKVEPITFEDPELFIQALREMDHLNLLWEDLNQGRATSGDIRKSFDSHKSGISDLPPDKKRGLLIALLSNLQEEDVLTLHQYWDPQLQGPVCAAIRSNLQYPEFKGRTLSLLCHLAEEKKWLPQFLDALLEPEPRSASPSEAMELIYQGLRRLDVSNPNELRHLRKKLVRDRRRLYEFAFILADNVTDETSFSRDLRWLEDTDPACKGELQVFRIAYGLVGSKDATHNQLSLLAETDASFVLRLIKLAVSISRKTNNKMILQRLAPSTVSWLVERLDDLSLAEEKAWKDLLPDIIDIEVDAEIFKHRADTLALALIDAYDQLNLDAALAESQQLFGQYLSKFIDVIYQTGKKKRRIMNMLAEHCAIYNFPVESHNINMLYLLSVIAPQVSDEQNRKVMERALTITERFPRLFSHEVFTKGLKKNLATGRNWHDYFKTVEAKLKNTLSRSSQSVEEVAGMCAELLCTSAWDKEDKILKLLLQKNFFDSSEKIDEFLGALQQQLEQQDIPAQDARSRVLSFREILLKTQSTTFNLYRQHLVDKAISNMKDFYDLMELIGEGLREDQAQELDVLAEKIREEVRKAGLIKRSFWSRK